MRALADDNLIAYSVDAPVASMSSVWVRRLRVAGLLLGVWAVPGIIAGFSVNLFASPSGEPPLMSLPRALSWQLLAWLPWALWSAVVLWLVRRVPFRRHAWGLALGVHVVVCAVVGTTQMLWAVVLDKVFLRPEGYLLSDHIREAFLRLTDFQVVTYSMVVAAGVAIDYFQRYREGVMAAERLRTEMVEAQLLALRSQLNPHFLFNALNSVISLMDRDVPAAQRMVARIGELLRLSLGADESEVTLSRELTLVKQYLEIERIRFGDRLTFEIEVPDDLLELMVPNLMLQPLVENAIVHGVGPRPGPGRVTLEAVRDTEALVLRVADDGLGLQRAKPHGGHGIGVRNTRARLEAMYGTDATFTLRTPPGGGCVAEIRLPLSFVMAP